MPYTITINAPAGPPICTRLPPRREMSPPAMMAVKIPASGLSPLAIENAIAKGSATIPTVNPAKTSFVNRVVL